MRDLPTAAPDLAMLPPQPSLRSGIGAAPAWDSLRGIHRTKPSSHFGLQPGGAKRCREQKDVLSTQGKRGPPPSQPNLRGQTTAARTRFPDHWGARAGLVRLLLLLQPSPLPLLAALCGTRPRPPPASPLIARRSSARTCRSALYSLSY